MSSSTFERCQFSNNELWLLFWRSQNILSHYISSCHRPIWKSWFMRSFLKSLNCSRCELMCVSKIWPFHLDKKCGTIHYLLRWPLQNDPKCVTQYHQKCSRERVIRIGILWRWLIYGALSQKCAYNSCWLLPYGLFTRCPIKFAPLSAAKGLRKIALITHVIEIFHFPRPQHYLHSNKVLCPHHKKSGLRFEFGFKGFEL